MTAAVEDEYSSIDHQIAIRAAKEQCESATNILFDVVTRARKFGLTWDQVALALGTSRQSAWERFSGR